MDVTPYLDLRTAPRIFFDALPERRSRARFMVPVKATDPAAPPDWKAVTWGAFGDEIRQLTLYLAHAGLRPGDRAVVYGTNSVDWFAAALAIQAAGGVMVPVYPSSTPEQAAYVVAHSDARVVFVEPALYSRVEKAEDSYEGVLRIVLLGEELPAPERQSSLVRRKTVALGEALQTGIARDALDPGAFDRLLNAVAIEQPGIMLYTSGTSGNPKGVPLTHKNVAVNGGDWMRACGPLLEERMTDLLWLPMSHIFGYGEACLGNQLGFISYLADPLTVMQRLPEVRPEVFMSVPSVWEKLAQGAQARATAAGDPASRTRHLADITGGKLRFCLSGGAGLKREVKELFHEAGVLIIEGYGLTETSPTLTLNRPDAFRFDSVGKPFESIEVMLAEDGEILARGPSVFSGYHKDPEATRAAFTEDGWFQTGDVGRFTEDGFLQIIDRKKDILVTAGGKNVPPANIEIRFKDDPLIAHLVVYGDAKRYLVAGVWLNPPETQRHLAEAGLTQAPERAQKAALGSLVQERLDEVNAQLASYESIKRFAIIDEALTLQSGHLTPTLKVKRKKVYETFKDVFEALYATGEARTQPGKDQEPGQVPPGTVAAP
jgi:long-chain acyl-CoA synthetase